MHSGCLASKVEVSGNPSDASFDRKPRSDSRAHVKVHQLSMGYLPYNKLLTPVKNWVGGAVTSVQSQAQGVHLSCGEI